MEILIQESVDPSLSDNVMATEVPRFVAVIKYGYSALDYARQYDPEWILLVKYLKELYDKYQTKLSRRQCRQQFKKVNVNPFPRELVYEMMAYLDNQSLCVVAEVSKEWNELATKPSLWETLLFDRFRISCGSLRCKASKTNKRKSTNAAEQPVRLNADTDVHPKILYQRMHESFLMVARRSAIQLQTNVPRSYLAGGILVSS